MEFEIDLHYYFGEEIMSCFNPILSDSELDEIVDEMAEEEYMSFMARIAGELESIGFEVIEGPTFSNQKGSHSCYFTLCNKDDYENLTVSFILNIRISDHRLSKRKGKNREWDRFEARRKYYDKELENYRELNAVNPNDMKHNEIEIFITGHKFRTYSDALKYIKNKVKTALESQ